LLPASIDSPRFRREVSILIRRLVYVAFFLEVGLLLILLPWSGFWEHNYFAAMWPPLQSFLTNNYLRGAVTGLGVVNLFAGFADLLLVFAARPSNTSGRPELVEQRDHADVTLRNGSGRT
jgi:formate hydrogenlyase subunit 3/multisubunit Na+/H+ antiporter MnhD subunit